jgi:hypothetical protein
MPIYPVPQNAPCVSAGINVLNTLQGKRPKATDVSPWYGVYGFRSYQSAELPVSDRGLTSTRSSPNLKNVCAGISM